MIEGLRLLPWVQEAARRNPYGTEIYSDCSKCMSATTISVRQQMGCGFEPRPPASVPVVPWLPLAAKPPRGHEGPFPTTCPGYTTKLPEVSEVARARFHHEKGGLGSFAGGEQPTENILDGIERLSLAVSEVQDWSMTPAKDGGGGS